MRPTFLHFVRASVPSLGALGMALVLAGCASEASAPSAAPSPLAADWQAHSRPLIFEGEGVNESTFSWRVPATLPAGRYRVVSLSSAGPVLVPGQVFEVDRDPMKIVYLQVPLHYRDLQAVADTSVLDH